ncbi:SLC13 family permease [uncultured Sphaerochaeta sp.]|uniref:SLC13 family permease n=1 Tax=uncultured Sphaerochaeta sp. TaxID=886478 RepID=UPI002A0A5074|nr:SLC13 family permease [uncultured Sphaerochaeta sp.]
MACLLALGSMFLVKPSNKYLTYIDFKVLGCLFCLMLVVAGFQKLYFFNHLSAFLLQFAHTPRQVSGILVCITFFLSMAITNDVALITFVPLTLIIFSLCKKTKPILLTIVLQTVAANIGSSLTPFGNPQNLFIFSYYSMTSSTFFKTMLPLVFPGALVLLLLLKGITSDKTDFFVQVETPLKLNKRQIIRYSVLFIVSLSAVFSILPWYIALLIVSIFSEKILFRSVDYSLLLTFLALFIFVGNLGTSYQVQNFFKNLLIGKVFLTSLFASQFISNVPATLLLAKFTSNATQLLLGVNAGGCGTLIASMASLISFKYFANFSPSQVTRYIVVFTAINVFFIILFLGIWSIFLQ